MLKVIERKTQKEGLASQLQDGRYVIDFGNGESKELAESTFKRLYTVLGEAQPSEEVASDVERVEQEELNLEPETAELDAPEMEVVETAEPEEEGQTQVDIVESTLGEGSLDALLAGAEEVDTENALQIVEEPQSAEKPKPEKPAEKDVSELGLDIKLLDWSMVGTRGGKTDKVSSQISIKGYLMDITEYAGYITDVKLYEENPNPPEDDPDAEWKLYYRSPKMSLKDTLEHLGLSADDMKIARKEITAIRKAVKAAHLEQLEEQKELESADADEPQETDEPAE
jgi:hypothetical protein